MDIVLRIMHWVGMTTRIQQNSSDEGTYRLLTREVLHPNNSGACTGETIQGIGLLLWMHTVGISMRDRCSKDLEGRKNSADFFQGRHGVQVLVCELLHGLLKVTDIPVHLLVDLHTLVCEIFFFPKRQTRYFPKLQVVYPTTADN